MRMVNDKPKVKNDSLYSPKETAFILGIGIATLYKHTKLGHIKPKYRECNNRRAYPGSEILRFWGAEY